MNHNRLNRMVVNSGRSAPVNEGTETDIIETIETIDDEIKKLREDYEAQMEELKETLNKANEAIANNSGSYSDIKKDIEAVTNNIAELSKKMLNMQQKSARFNAGLNAVKQSIGAEFVNAHGANLNRLASGAGRERMEFNRSITNAVTSIPTSAGSLIIPDRRDLVMPPQQQVWIRDLIAPGTTTSNAIEYPQMASFTNNAAPVAEGELKPESDMAFAMKTANVRVIAHWIRASKQVLDDVPRLQSIIETMLLYGLKLTEEAQILFGDGTGENLEGLMVDAEPFDETLMTRLKVANPQAADRLRAAILQVINTSMIPASGIVLNPVDAAGLELLKDENGNYLGIYRPDGTVWRLPVTETPSMEEDEFLVGAFYAGAQLFDREQSAIEVSTEDGDNFRRNMITIRAEERLALAKYFTKAFVKGSLTA